MHSRQRRFANIAAFTLAEMLLSFGVLLLLILAVAQVTNSSTSATTHVFKQMDTDEEARMILDRMGSDFDRMIKRADVDYVFLKQSGNDAMWFYSEAPSYYPPADGNNVSIDGSAKSSVALVGYRINSTYKLDRLGKGLTWDRTASPKSSVFLTYPSGSSTPITASTLAGNWPTTVTTTSTDRDYNLISDQVYRLEFSFLLKDGTLSVNQYIAPNTAINGFKDVAAIVVGIAMLDRNSRNIVKRDTANPTLLDSTIASQMISALPDAEAGKPIAQTWTNSPYLTASAIPQAAAAEIRFYQRYFYLYTK